jgi:hypothetical protein
MPGSLKTKGIAVGDPENGARSLFLHVFEIADEQVREPTEVKFVPPAGVVIGDRWRVSFNPDGPLGGKVNDNGLATSLKTEAQYDRK